MTRPRPLTHVEQVAADFRQGLLQREAVTVGKIGDAYRTVLAQIQRDMDKLLGELEQAAKAGKPISSSMLFRQGRLEKLRTDAMRELARVGAQALDLVENARLTEIATAIDQAAQLVDAAFAGEGTARVATSITAGIPTGSVSAIAAATQRDTPLRRTLEAITRGSTETAVNHLINGVALGQNPRKIAAAMRKELAVPQWHAERIARTEVMRAHRASTLERFQTFAGVDGNGNALEGIGYQPIVEGWVWCASSGNCCVACLAMHGTKHSLDETLDGHPNCRCVMLPILVSAADLGYDSGPDMLTGEDLLAGMIEGGDLDHFGPGVRDALESGRANLSDFVQVRTDPTWGSMRSQRSLRSVLETT